MNQLKTGAVLSYISMGLGYIISIIYTPLMLRLLGQSEYGLYNLVASVVAYLGVLNFGFGSAYIRFYSRFKVDQDDEKIFTLNGMFVIIFSCLGLIAIIAGLILVFYSNNIFGNQLSVNELYIAKILMVIMVINLAISFPNIIFTSYITANEKFIFQKILNMVKLIANPFLILPLLFLGYGAIGMVLMTTVVNICIEVSNIYYCFKKLNMKFLFKRFDFSLMKEMTIFSFFIFINIIVDQVNWNVDKFLLGRFHGAISVAIYGLSAQLNNYYIAISSTISNVFIPRVNLLVASDIENSKLLNLFIKVGRVQFIMMSFAMIFMIFFGKYFVEIWAGKNYSDSYLILLFLIIPVTVPLIQNIGISIQRAKNMHKFRSWTYFFIAVCNVIITIPLAKHLGGIGAAIGTAISLLIGNGLIMNWYYHNKLHLDMFIFWKKILNFFPALVLPSSIGLIFLLNKKYHTLSVFFIFIVCYSIVFFSSMWYLGFNNFEKDLIKSPVKKVYNKLIKRQRNDR